jgi:hypothetical protein
MKKRVSIAFAVVLAVAVTTSLVQANSVGLVSYWPFDVDVNDAFNGNHGNNHGATFVPGVLGQALYFDGTTYVEVANDPSLEPVDTIAVAAWVKRSGSPGTCKYIVSKYLPDRFGSHSSYGLYTGGGGLRFYVGHYSGWRSSPQAAASLVWDGEWHCVAGTFDGSEVKLYVDGTQVDGATSDLQDIYYHEQGNLFFGHYYPENWLAFSGYVDEVRIWDRALTAEEVARNCQLRVEVNIDIKPGSDPNSINLGSKGVVPVAVLTTDDFDASSVDPVTVLFAGASPVRWTMEDVDGDGDLDLLFHFKTQELVDLDASSTEAILTGTTFGGQLIQGTDTVERGGAELLLAHTA